MSSNASAEASLFLTAIQESFRSLAYNGWAQSERLPMNILLVEDQQRLAQAIAAILGENGHRTDVVGDGRSGLDFALIAQRNGTPYDAMVLDVMLPRMDGFTVARELRRSGNSVPLIMLTARDSLCDKIEGLDCGADDYLTKPFQPAELLARLRALTRRSGSVHIETIELGNTVLDLQSGDLRAGTNAATTNAADAGAAGTAGTAGTAGADVHLSQREFKLCQLLMTNPGQTLTKASLLARVWGFSSEADENSVEAYVSFLRKKLAYLESDLCIVTVRGMGYRLEVGGTDAR
jgi:DNA-binding response OmpR family regulator